MEDTWILLTIIFTVLISLLIFEKWKRNKSDNHLSINEKFVINQNNVGQKEAISMRLLLENKTITLIEAIDLFNYAIKINPTEIRHHFWLAKTYYTIGKFDLSNKEFKIVLSLQAKDSDDSIMQSESEKYL